MHGPHLIFVFPNFLILLGQNHLTHQTHHVPKPVILSLVRDERLSFLCQGVMSQTHFDNLHAKDVSRVCSNENKLAVKGKGDLCEWSVIHIDLKCSIVLGLLK